MCAVLYEAANNFVHQHFVEVSMLEEFLALPLEDVLELLSRDELHVKVEEQVGPPLPGPPRFSLFFEGGG